MKRIQFSLCFTVFATLIATDASSSPLSARARELEQDMVLLDRVQRACLDLSKARTRDCAALREFQTVGITNALADSNRQRPHARQECAEGNLDACLVASCPVLLMMETSETVRGCSNYKQLSNTAQWAQMDEGGNVLCLTKAGPQSDVELDLAVFPEITVELSKPDGSPAEKFRVMKFGAGDLRGKSFATFAEAADAGCLARLRALRQASLQR